MTKASSPPHEPWIDWLRALASIAVVFSHLTAVRGGQDHGPYESVTAWGGLGVQIFFVVSGYCVMLSSLKRPSPLEFLFKRYVRVLPPYWASLLVVLAVVVIRKTIGGQNDVTALPHSPFAILATLTLMTKPITAVPTMNWVYWTLSYELAFYGLMTLALVRRKLFEPIMLAAATASLVLVFYPMTRIAGLFFLDQWPLFALGVGLAEAIHRRSLFGYAMLAIASAGMVLALPHAVAAAGPGAPPVAAGLAGGLTALSIFLVRCFPAFEARLRSRVFAFLGGISYSLYLIHVPVGVYLLGHLVALGSVSYLPLKIALHLLIVGGCIAVAFVFNRVVEQPSQKLARSVQARRRAARAVATVLPEADA